METQEKGSVLTEVNEAVVKEIQVIGKEEVAKALETLQRYHEGKQNLEQKIKENEEWWKLRHWSYIKNEKEQEKRIEPASAWLFNGIANKHADIMDNYPEANVLPREQGDEKAAKMLSSILPVLLEQNDYEGTYSDVGWYKLKTGTGITGVFWDGSKNNGLGDVAIRKCDVMNLFWESGIKDIQDSANVFYVALEDYEEMKKQYPQIGSKGGTSIGLTNYVHSDAVDETNKVAVVDWYYKKRVVSEQNRIRRIDTQLHYCKFCNGEVLYASENDPQYANRGWYDHGEYPFVFDPLFPVEDSICGFSYIDVMKDSQGYTDKMQQAILENALLNAKPRYAVRDDAGLNEEDFADVSKTVLHFTGDLGENSFRQIVTQPISGIYETIMLNKVEEMKDTIGNTAASQGQTTNVTSASGIASLQEASGKLSRDSNRGYYRAYTKICYLVIELIRQFYDEPRCFRITGENGQEEYVSFDNSAIKPQESQMAFGTELGSRMPVFDIKVVPAKQSAYTRETQNQLAMQFYQMGFFAPQNVEQTMGCLAMMDFDGKAEVEERLNKSQTYYNLYMQTQQQLMEMAQMVDMQNQTNFVERIAGNAQMIQGMLESSGMAKSGSVSAAGSKGSLSHQAASAARNSTAI